MANGILSFDAALQIGIETYEPNPITASGFCFASQVFASLELLLIERSAEKIVHGLFLLKPFASKALNS